MSVNKYKPHVFILPEDRANRQIANGFILHPSIAARHVQVLGEAGRWCSVIDKFEKNHIDGLKRYNDRHLIMLVDFDQNNERRAAFEESIPEDLKNRVFILGTWKEPEDLKRDLGDFEKIGRDLAEACWDPNIQENPWNHKLLQCNADELRRMMGIIKPILLP